MKFSGETRQFMETLAVWGDKFELPDGAESEDVPSLFYIHIIGYQGGEVFDGDYSDDARDVFLDSWGNDLIYRTEGRSIIEIWSKGPDGVWEEGAGDDIGVDMSIGH